MNNFINRIKQWYHQSVSNPGTKIKGYAKTLNLIYMIIMFVSLVVWLFYGIDVSMEYHYSYYGGGYSSFNPLIYFSGFLAILCSYAALYITCVFLAAFGELVENSTSLVDLKVAEMSKQSEVDLAKINEIINETLGE